MPAPARTVDSSTLLRARFAALLEIPGFEQVVATWLQALATMAIVSKRGGRGVYLSAVTELLHATEEALTILPAGWTRALSPDRPPGGTSCPPHRKASSRAAAWRAEQLTPREREVAALIASGCSNRQIAAALVVSDATAERHVANILSKLGMRSRVDIAIWASVAADQPPDVLCASRDSCSPQS